MNHGLYRQSYEWRQKLKGKNNPNYRPLCPKKHNTIIYGRDTVGGCYPCSRERRWKRYGITELTWDVFMQVLSSQNYECPFDNRKLTFKTGRADHDHISGKFRGVLCHRCNNRIGWLERYKKQAIDYINGIKQ